MPVTLYSEAVANKTYGACAGAEVGLAVKLRSAEGRQQLRSPPGGQTVTACVVAVLALFVRMFVPMLADSLGGQSV